MVDTTDWYDDFISEEEAEEIVVEPKNIADKEKAPSLEEDIVELTDIAEVEKSSPAKDEIIELTDIAEKESTPPAEEDIIELTDIADADKAVPPEQEEIIELTDIADADKAVPPAQEEIIELNDVVGDENQLPEKDEIIKEGIKPVENLEMEDDSSTDGSGLKMEDSVGEPSHEPDVVPVPGNQINVTSKQMEDALESVIEKKFADKIDLLLTESMEKVLKKEIAEIKERLKRDFDHLD